MKLYFTSRSEARKFAQNAKAVQCNWAIVDDVAKQNPEELESLFDATIGKTYRWIVIMG